MATKKSKGILESFGDFAKMFEGSFTRKPRLKNADEIMSKMNSESGL